jgi:inward rectifier potassium channel
MARTRRFKINAKSEDNTGFSNNSAYSGGRFFSKDGKANVIKRGIGLFERNSIFHFLLAIPRWKFYSLIFLFFIIVNLIFACIYYAIGIEHLGGMVTSSPLEKFGEAFFFSAQTFTTVGYGRINPTGFITSMVAAIEALLGLLSFAVATGLLYGRFSRPQAFLRFSDHAVIAPYKEITAIMFRMVPFKNNHLTDAEVKLTLGMRLEENGIRVNRFYNLDLEIAKVNALALSWTIVHAIDDKSPMYGYKYEDLVGAQAEILVFVRAFDESFANTVIARTSYTMKEVLNGAKFKPMFHPNADSTSTILHIDKLNETETAALPEPILLPEESNDSTTDAPATTDATQ